MTPLFPIDLAYCHQRRPLSHMHGTRAGIVYHDIFFFAGISISHWLFLVLGSITAYNATSKHLFLTVFYEDIMGYFGILNDELGEKYNDNAHTTRYSGMGMGKYREYNNYMTII